MGIGGIVIMPKKYWKIAARIIIGLLAFVIIAPWFLSMGFNNIALWRFSRQLDTISAPTTIALLERKDILGKLNGNGNGMDFLACRLIRTDMGEDALERSLNLPEFHSARGSDWPVAVEIVPMASAELESDYLEHGRISFDDLSGVQDYTGYYALIIYDGGYDALFDIRGH